MRRHTILQKGLFKKQISRHNEIVDELARKICKDLKGEGLLPVGGGIVGKNGDMHIS